MENNIIITSEHFLKYSIQPLWIWYDRFGDISQKGDLSETIVGQARKEDEYRKSYFALLEGAKIGEADPKKAFAKTLQLMQEGVPYICNGCIQIEYKGVVYRGYPDILEKREGASLFGNWYYAPMEIKAISKVQRLERQQLAFYSLILKKIQGKFPISVKVIDNKRDFVLVTLQEKDVFNTRETTKEIVDIMGGKKPETNVTTKAKNSPWFNLMFEEAKGKKDISLIRGINRRGKKGLRDVGINTLDDLIACDFSQLPKIPYAPPIRIKKAWLQAKSILENQVIPMVTLQIPGTGLNLYFTVMANSSVSYLFGIRVTGDPEREYIKNNNKKNIKFYDNKDGSYFIYFIAEKEDEKNMWYEFLRWIKILPDNYTVYHYSNAQKFHLKKLAEKYESCHALETFQGNLFNVQKTLEDSVALPLYSYSLCDVAQLPCIDFCWRHKKPGISEVSWYKKWLETGDSKAFQCIIDDAQDTAKAVEKALFFICESCK